MNHAIIIGNLTRDPDRRSTKAGIEVCTFTIAANRKTGDTQTADFFKCTAWRKLAPICNNWLRKGRKVMVTGPVSLSTYEGRDGKTHAEMCITVQDMEFLTPKSEQPPVEDTLPPVTKQSEFIRVDEELPF